MPIKYRLTLVFFLSLLILVFSVHAVHGPSPAHARRSLAFKKKSQRQLGGLPALVNDILGNGTTPTPGPTSPSSSTPSSSSSPTNPTTNTDPPSTSTTPSLSDTPSITPTPSTSHPPSSSSPTSTTTPTPSTTDPGSSSSTSTSTSDTPTSTPPTITPASSSPSPTASLVPNCLLDLLGNCIPSSSSPPVSSTSDTPVTTPTSPASTPTPTSSSSPSLTVPPTSLPPQSTPTSSSDTTTSTPDCPLGVVIGGVCVLPSSTPTPPASSSIPPPTSEPPPSTSPPGVIDVSLSSTSPSPATSNPGQSSSPTPTPTSSPPVDPCGPVGIALGLCLSSSSPPPSNSPLTSAPSPSPSLNLPESSSSSNPPLSSSQSPSVDPCGDLGISRGLCTSSVPPVSQSCDPLGLCSSTTPLSSGTQIPSNTIPSSDTPSKTQSQPSLSSGQSSNPTGDSSSGSSSSSIPVISFPSRTSSDISITSFSSTSTNDRPLLVTPPPQTQLSYVTVTSLLLASSSTTSSSDTLNDPDAVPSTLTFATPSNSLPTSTPINLPPDLPARIYAPGNINSDLPGYSLISFLFKSTLSWTFVASNTQAQGQIFLWMPTVVGAGLDIDPANVPVYALQVYIPEDYRGPQDVDLLLTSCLMYVPTEDVPVLAAQVLVASSPFYTRLADPYHTLVNQVDPSFPINSVEDPNAVPGTTSSVTHSRNNSRKDAIIGVTSALGGLAFGALGILVYRSVKRNRDLRHQRLTESNVPNASYPDRTGRDFDQDSIGGQRRRSFYFAEDSLRGQDMVQQTAVQSHGQHVTQPVSQVEYSCRTSPDGVRERRAPVVTGAISAPILTQSSLNW